METGDEGVGQFQANTLGPCTAMGESNSLPGTEKGGGEDDWHCPPLLASDPQGLAPFPPGARGGELTVCGGLQAYGPFVSLSVRYRLWETGNIREARQTGRGKRPGCQAGWRGGGRGSPHPPWSVLTPLPTAPAIHALGHAVCLALPLAGVKVGPGPGGGPEDGVADGLWGRVQSFYSANISCLGSCPSSTVG